MKYFQPNNKEYSSLEEVLLTNDGFVAVSDDWKYALYIDWDAYDDDEKKELFVLSGKDEEEIDRAFHEWVFWSEGQEDHVATMADAFATVANWRDMKI